MFEGMRALGGQIDRMVYASSAAVYGPPDAYPPGSLPANSRLLPTTHYGAFKVCNESNAQVFWRDHGITSVGLRPWAVYGVGRDVGMTSGPTKAIKAVVSGRKYAIRYGGWQDLQYVEDVAATFVCCLESPSRGAWVFNLRGSVVDMPTFHRTLSDVVPEAADLIRFSEEQLPIAFDLDDSHLRAEVPGIPFTPLDEGIRRTVQHFRRLKAEGRLDMSDLDT
jgi:nucleoside-diphosphate-sugar epimerase